MHQMRSYVAGAGAGTTLLLAAVAAFLAFGSAFPYNEWPIVADWDEETVSIAGEDPDGESRSVPDVQIERVGGRREGGAGPERAGASGGRDSSDAGGPTTAGDAGGGGGGAPSSSGDGGPGSGGGG
ncbi:MAG TPA: hypothetical protein VFY99_07975, partial [Solirubrobacterales bacterium]